MKGRRRPSRLTESGGPWLSEDIKVHEKLFVFLCGFDSILHSVGPKQSARVFPEFAEYFWNILASSQSLRSEENLRVDRSY